MSIGKHIQLFSEGKICEKDGPTITQMKVNKLIIITNHDYTTHFRKMTTIAAYISYVLAVSSPDTELR